MTALQVFSNFASTTLAVPALSTNLSLTVTNANQIPTLLAGQYCYAVLGNPQTGPWEEVCIIGPYTSGTTTLTLGPSPIAGGTGRGMDGTIAQAWSAGATIQIAPVAQAMADITAQFASTAAGQGDALITVLQPATGAVACTLHDINLRRVTVKDFGAVGDGVTNDYLAFNNAISWANSRGGIDRADITGTTIIIPDGRYYLGTPLTAITRSGCWIRGESSQGAVLVLAQGITLFTVGDGAFSVVGCGLSNVKLEYLGSPSTPLVGNCVVVLIDAASDFQMQDVYLTNIGTLICAGVSSSRSAAGISINGLIGSVNNCGLPLFDLCWGAGLSVVKAAVFVGGVVAPSISSTTASFATNVMTLTTAAPALTVGSNVNQASVIPGTTITALASGVLGAIGSTYTLSTSPGTVSNGTVGLTGQMTTVPGSSVILGNAGFWDTVQFSNCIFEQFDVGLSIDAGSGMVYQNMLFSNCIFDYFRRYVAYLESDLGGVVSGIRFDTNCWMTSWDTDTLVVTGAGAHTGHTFSGQIPWSGGRAAYLSGTNTTAIDYIDINIGANCRNLSCAAAMEFAAGSTGFRVIDCSGNGSTALSVGFDVRAGYGLQLGANADKYQVTGCSLDGRLAGMNVIANSSGSVNRRVFNNNLASYRSTSYASMPASGVTATNMTPNVVDLDFYGGTLSTGFVKNGVGIPGAATTHLHLEPGDTYSCGYTVAPTVVQSVLG